jgi:hypothetical protein
LRIDYFGGFALCLATYYCPLNRFNYLYSHCGM